MAIAAIAGEGDNGIGEQGRLCASSVWQFLGECTSCLLRRFHIWLLNMSFGRGKTRGYRGRHRRWFLGGLH